MDDYIVKVKMYTKNECIRCGTGIVISDREVITAAHVAQGDQHTLVLADEEEIPLSIAHRNDVAVVLKAAQILTFESATIFSIDELLDTQARWTVNGFITVGQCAHQMTGMGIVYAEMQNEISDYYLVTIDSGKSKNYEGLSGSPVVSCGRIVGILQVQSTNTDGGLGVQMASVRMFRELLMAYNLQPNEYETLIRAESQALSLVKIADNKKNRKYIPDIFVEEGLHKEQLRYFADPLLFMKKAIRECKLLDFSTINQYLVDLGLSEINFSDFPEEFLPEELETVAENLSDLLRNAAEALAKCSERIEIKEVGIERYYEYRCACHNSMRHYLEKYCKLLGFVSCRYLLLTKRAGQGKTNFLCDFTVNFLLKKDYCVLYFNANDLYEEPMQILRRILGMQERYDHGYVDRVLEHAWRRTGRPTIIVIDGLNENAHPQFGHSMCGFLKECNTIPHIKIIMSTRNELLEERFGNLLQARVSMPFQHLDMKENNERFKERIFQGYLRFFDIGIRWNTLTQWAFDTLTEDVLLLRFFCEVNEHKKQIYMYDVYKYDVFNLYLDNKREAYKQYQQLHNVVDAGELFYSLLDFICKHMLDTKSYYRVPLGIFSQEQQQLLRIMLENDVIFREDEVIEYGILQRDTAVISFTFDEFRDFCLTNYILTHYHERERFHEFWNTMELENSVIREGIERYVFYLSKTKYKDKLLSLVRELERYEELYWKYIWNIEDQYITVDDAARWRDQILQDGEYISKTVKHLLFKYDCECFTGTNIKLLFEALDELAAENNRYNSFVKSMFRITKKDKYGTEPYDPKRVIAFDHLLKELHKHVEDNVWVYRHKELLRLVIYLYELDATKAQALWDSLYVASPEIAIGLLQEMNGNIRCMIRGNVKDILLGLLRRQQSDEYALVIEQLNTENNFGQGIADIAQTIAGIFDEES